MVCVNNAFLFLSLARGVAVAADAAAASSESLRACICRGDDNMQSGLGNCFARRRFLWR